MSLIARILGVSLITSAIVAGAGFFLLVAPRTLHGGNRSRSNPS